MSTIRNKRQDVLAPLEEALGVVNNTGYCSSHRFCLGMTAV